MIKDIDWKEENRKVKEAFDKEMFYKGNGEEE